MPEPQKTQIKNLIRLDPEDHAAAKSAAALKMQTLHDFIIEAIREKTARESQKGAA